jgi:leucyl aminopeptidase
MEIQAITGKLQTTDADAIMLYLVQDGSLINTAKEIDAALDGAISEIIEAGDFSGKLGDTFVFYTGGAIPAKRVIIAGLGEEEKITLDTVRRAAANGLKKARDLKIKHVATVPAGVRSGRFETSASTQALCEGSLLALYQYHGQKSSDTPENLPETLSILSDDTDSVESGIALAKAFANGTYLARELINLPPNIVTPEYLAQRAESMAKEVGLKSTILGRQQMEALKMGALLGVAQGSDYPPQFIVLEHNADKSDDYDTIVLVGKGVTFDTGGYSLKTGQGMTSMKADMSGGAAVIGAMQTIAELNMPLHVVGLIPAADNMISGNAYRPQEVLTASNGKTIEIMSTDAEGRLLLADALVYAQRYKPDAVLDMATLTGSIMVALGHVVAGVFSNDDSLVAKLNQAGEATHERIWHMPMYEEHGASLKSDTADTKNNGDRAGGACSAAYFLSNFVDYNWVHIDIAGMISNDGSIPYMPKHSAKGYGSRLLAEFVRQWAE